MRARELWPCKWALDWRFTIYDWRLAIPSRPRIKVGTLQSAIADRQSPIADSGSGRAEVLHDCAVDVLAQVIPGHARLPVTGPVLDDDVHVLEDVDMT